MLRFGVVTFALCALGGCRSPVVTVDVRNPCNTFVSESAPRTTPEVRRRNGEYELVVSFTPAPNDEAKAVREAAKSGAELILHPSGERVRALGLDGGHLVLRVASEGHAKSILEQLCFRQSP